MALTDNSNMVMPVAPAYAGYGNNGGIGDFGGDWGWIILLLLISGGGWGFGNGMGMMGFDMMGGFGLYPWMNQADITTSGFQNAATNSAIASLQNSVTSGFGDIQTSLCSGFAGVNASVNNAQNSIAQQLYSNQIADLERSYAAQTASTQGMSAIQSQLAQCCCDNRLATCQTQNIVQNEANATRFADANNTRDIIDTQTRGTQAILDKLCQLELDNYKNQLDSKNDTIAQLRQEVLYAKGQASQDVQTAQILAGQTAEVDALYNRLNNCPVGTVPVYGRQPIFTCGNGNGCGCNM